MIDFIEGACCCALIGFGVLFLWWFLERYFEMNECLIPWKQVVMEVLGYGVLFATVFVLILEIGG